VKAATVDEQETLSGRARESVTGWWGRARRFLSEVRNEMGRVTWPSRKEVYATTFVVILFSVVMGVYLWGVDMILTKVLNNWLYHFLGGS
jgi:preprotein translocase subunit SecE